MKYRTLIDGMYRSYCSMGSWGIGIMIVKKRTRYVAEIDIGADDEIHIVKEKPFDELPVAKLWAKKEVMKIINELGKWAEE